MVAIRFFVTLSLRRLSAARGITGAVKQAVLAPGYGEFQTDDERRKYLAHVIAYVTKRVMNGFRRQTRRDDLGERERLEQYQRRLEGRGGTKGRQHFKL